MLLADVGVDDGKFLEVIFMFGVPRAIFYEIPILSSNLDVIGVGFEEKVTVIGVPILHLFLIDPVVSLEKAEEIVAAFEEKKVDKSDFS